jgi:hypothetical protein
MELMFKARMCVCTYQHTKRAFITHYYYYYYYYYYITFIQDVYNHMPRTNYVVSEVYKAAGILCLHYMEHVMLFLMINIL